MGTKVIWDGKDLPPIGCKVLIKLASKTDPLPYEVTGYAVRRPQEDVAPWLFVVVIKIKSPGGASNERFLNEVFPLDSGVKYAN